MTREPSERDTSHRPEELEEYARDLDGGELVLVVQQLTSSGAPSRALALCAAAREAGKESRGLQVCEARARFLLGDQAGALRDLARLVGAQPRDCAARFAKAQLHAQAGETSRARDELAQLVRVAPDYPGALPTLARLTFPGPTYREVLGWLHALLRPATYLEIGVEHGQSLALATRATRIVGVDPYPRIDPARLPGHARIHAQTSDEFFARHGLADATGGERIDLAFIDGLHAFEQLLRDFSNVEAWCAPDATIVLHDCLPVVPIAASRRRQTSFWVGDCWKALEALLARRRDLALGVVPTHPSGLVIARRLDPGSRRLVEERASIEAEWMHETPPSPSRWQASYPLLANAPDAIAAFVSATGTEVP